MLFKIIRSILLPSIFSVSIVGCASVDATRDIDQAHSIIHEHVPFDASKSIWSAGDLLTMDMAIGTAIVQDALLRRDLAVIVQRRAELVQSGQLPNPTFSGAFGIAADGLSGAPLVLNGMQGLSWLWTRPDRVAAAEYTLQQAILTSASRAITVAKHVKTIFAQVHFANELVTLAQSEVELASRELELAMELHTIGEVAQNDIDLARIHLSKSKLNLIKFQEQLENSTVELLTAMGMPTEELAIDIQAMPIRSADLHDQFNTEALLILAVTQRLDLSTKYASVNQMSSALGFANPPIISASVGFNENFGNREAYLPGISITIPLDGKAKEASALSKLEQAKAIYTDALRQVQSEVRTALHSYVGTLEQLQILRDEHIDPTGLLVSRTMLLMNMGEATSQTLLELEHQLVIAKQAEVNLLLRAYEMYYQLQFAVGGTFDNVSQTVLSEEITHE